MTESPQAASAWAPLRQPLFRSLWIASVVSNIGAWMEDVGEAWLMTSQTPSPLLVALLQTAESLPIFLLALPAGALADVVDRRRLLLFTQVWMYLAATALGVWTLLGLTTPTVLLLFAFTVGTATALNMPAWQAIMSSFSDSDALDLRSAPNSSIWTRHFFGSSVICLNCFATRITPTPRARSRIGRV